MSARVLAGAVNETETNPKEVVGWAPAAFVSPGRRPFPLACFAAGLLAASVNLRAQSPGADSLNPNPCCYGVYALAMQTDGKIVVGGDFSTLGGQPRESIGRLNPDGSVDSSFNPGTWHGDNVNALAVQADGKILIGGMLYSLGGQPRQGIGRLTANGNLDTAFNPGANGAVLCLGVQADGKILVGGSFSFLGGQPRNCIGRLNAGGSLDTSFNPGADGTVCALAVQPDGKILLGGYFTALGGQSRTNIGRLNANGSLDATFNPGARRYPYGSVQSLVLRTDGRILVAGDFITVTGQARTNLARLNADGSLDSSFNAWANGAVQSLAVQPDGKVLAAGYFTTLCAQPRNRIGRLNADGSLDTGFDPGVEGYVLALVPQPDWKVVVGGSFTMLGGQWRTNIGRLYNTVCIATNLTFDGSTITWLRSGPAPEAWRTTFDISTNGSNWVSLGAGQRIIGGWQLAGLNYPANAAIRARGFIGAGAWFVETVLAPSEPLQFVTTNGNLSVSDGQFRARLAGTAHANVAVETSPDLMAWTLWQSNTLPVGGWDFSVPISTNHPGFFRARLLP